MLARWRLQPIGLRFRDCQPITGRLESTSFESHLSFDKLTGYISPGFQSIANKFVLVISKWLDNNCWTFHILQYSHSACSILFPAYIFFQHSCLRNYVRFGFLFEIFMVKFLPRNSARFDIFGIFVEHDQPFSDHIHLCLFYIHIRRFGVLFDERNLCNLKCSVSEWHLRSCTGEAMT